MYFCAIYIFIIIIMTVECAVGLIVECTTSELLMMLCICVVFCEIIYHVLYIVSHCLIKFLFCVCYHCMVNKDFHKHSASV